MTVTTKTELTAKRQRKMAREPKPGNARSEVLAHEGASPAELAAATAPPSAGSTTRAPSKSGLVLEMLTRPEGASLDQLVAATGWLPHTTRAALTGLKKKGHVITSEKPANGPRIYRNGAAITTAEAAT